ncbi:MAG: TRAM domain-containing protein, partial [Planctomycetota bacterium]
VRRCRFKNSYIFKYSPRAGTKAFELMIDDVPEEVKRRRNNELLALQSEISEEDNAEFIGRRVEILVEGPSKTARAAAAEGSGPLQLVGRTMCDRIVVFDGNPRLAGHLAEVEIDDCTATTLIGHIVTHEHTHSDPLALPILG